MEMHLVHTNMKYLNNSAEALKNPDGLAVIGIFFTLDAPEALNAFEVKAAILKQ